MENKLEIFKSAEFGEIRTVMQDGEPWFVAADVCKALELTNPTMAVDRLDEDEKAKFNLGLSGGATNVVNEYGLYTLVLASRKEEAKAFKRWITHEVLHAIRKHGAYMTGKTIAEVASNPDLLMQIATNLKAEQEARRIAENARLLAEQEAKAKQAVIEEQAPQVAFAKAIVGSKRSILVGELAKILTQNGVRIGQNRLYEWLRQNGCLCNTPGDRWNKPMQRYMEMGLFELKEVAFSVGAEMRTSTTVKITGKGQEYFINKLLNTEVA